MNKLAVWMTRLYPKGWRARYGDELDALLADTGADARVVTDLFRGGIRMQFKTWSFLKLAIALGLGGLLLGAGVAQLLPSIYISRATLQIAATRIDENMPATSLRNGLNARILQMETQLLSRTELSRIITNPRLDLYATERKVKPLEDVIEDMKAAIHVDFIALPGALGERALAVDIGFTYPDRFLARQTVQALTDRFMEISMTPYSADARSEGVLQVVETPSLPQSPISPNRLVIVFMGFLAGIVMAFLWRATRKTGFIRQPLAIAAVTLVITLLTAGLSYLIPNQFRSNAAVQIAGRTHEDMRAMREQVLSRTVLAAVVNDPRLLLYRDELKTMPLEDVIEQMKKHLQIDLLRTPDAILFTVGFDGPDRYKDQMVVNAILDKLDWANAQMPPITPRPQPNVLQSVIEVLDQPNLPTSPIKPNRYVIAAIGGIIGIVLAALIAIIRRRWKPEPDFPVNAIPE